MGCMHAIVTQPITAMHLNHSLLWASKNEARRDIVHKRGKVESLF